MTGVVICGGSSTRMGQDKGLLKAEEETWAELAERKLVSLQLPVVISINKEQAAVYENVFDREKLVADHPGLSFRAPLAGLLSVHLAYPHEDLLVLACDLKDMRPELLQQLQNEFVQAANEAVVYTTLDGHQPLCGIYTAAGLQKIYRQLKDGTLGRYSMMHVLEILQTKYCRVETEDLPAFNNYNRAEDL